MDKSRSSRGRENRSSFPLSDLFHSWPFRPFPRIDIGRDCRFGEWNRGLTRHQTSPRAHQSQRDGGTAQRQSDTCTRGVNRADCPAAGHSSQAAVRGPILTGEIPPACEQSASPGCACFGPRLVVRSAFMRRFGFNTASGGLPGHPIRWICRRPSKGSGGLVAARQQSQRPFDSESPTLRPSAWVVDTLEP